MWPKKGGYLEEKGYDNNNRGIHDLETMFINFLSSFLLMVGAKTLAASEIATSLGVSEECMCYIP